LMMVLTLLCELMMPARIAIYIWMMENTINSHTPAAPLPTD